ncbi:MAG TPA: GNAT family N-acetyltransferase [Ignavibacteria bacterium]|nr:GNAT family N-acetyltransferase [Ignavibacteria bacterium]
MYDIIKCENIEKDIEWLEFLRNQYNIFFDPVFLKYNDEFNKNFKWHHLKIRDNKTNKIVAIIPGNEKIIDEKRTYFSCDGVSFAGFLWKNRLDASNYIKVIPEFKEYLINEGFEKCIIKGMPFLYKNTPDEENEYSFFQAGFNISSYAITNIINLDEFDFKNISGSKKRSINKSKQFIKINSEVELNSADEFIAFYNVLKVDRNLKNVVPTHSREELEYLTQKLKKRIILFSAEVDGVIAGICILFCITNSVVLNFYLAQVEEYNKTGIPEYILYESINWAKKNGFKYYDIGTSSVNNKLSEGLFQFKKTFLANGFLRKNFELNL